MLLPPKEGRKAGTEAGWPREATLPCPALPWAGIDSEGRAIGGRVHERVSLAWQVTPGLPRQALLSDPEWRDEGLALSVAMCGFRFSGPSLLLCLIGLSAPARLWSRQRQIGFGSGLAGPPR